MPELPEVETTCRGIEPRIKGAVVEQVIIRQAKLRWPIPTTLPHDLPGQCLQRVKRRAKYLLLQFDQGTLILHLGMSGSLRVLKRGSPPQTHDHFEITFDNNRILRLRDPAASAQCFGPRPLQPTTACSENWGLNPSALTLTGPISTRRAAGAGWR